MPEPTLGQEVYFFNEDRQPHAAWIAQVLASTSNHVDLPFCNLAILNHDGSFNRRRNVGPAYYDGERWHLLGKWAYRTLIPPEAYADPTLPTPTTTKVGNTRAQISVAD